MKMKRILALLLACLLMVGMLAACGSDTPPASDPVGENSPGAENPGTGDQRTQLTLAFTPFESLNPYTTLGSPLQIVGKAVFQPLLCEYNGEVCGVIGKDWEWKDDYTLVVEMYDTVYDSAGNHITADDVVFSWNTWQEAGAQAENTSKTTALVKTGDYTVEITFAEPVYPSVIDGALGFAIVSEKAYSADGFATNPIGTGGYVVKEFSSSSYLVVEKNPNAWQKDESLLPDPYKPRVDVVRIDMLSETEQIRGALEAGNVQIGAIDALVSMEFEGNPELGVVKVPMNYSPCIVLNGLEGPLADNLALRQAVLYAIDCATLAYGMSNGTGHVAYTIGDEKLVGYNPEWETDGYYDYDVEKAKALLAEAGYAPGELTLSILSPAIPGMDMLAQLVQANLKEIGINLEIDLPDNASYMARRNAYTGDGWDLCTVATVPKGYMINTLGTIGDCEIYNNGTLNICGFYDEELNSLYETALADPTNVEKMSALHQWIEDNAWAYGFAVAYNFWGIDSGIEELVFSASGEIVPTATVLKDSYDVFAN